MRTVSLRRGVSVWGLLVSGVVLGELAVATAAPVNDETHRDRVARVVDESGFVDYFSEQVERSLLDRPVVEGSGRRQVKAFVKAVDWSRYRDGFVDQLVPELTVKVVERILGRYANGDRDAWKEEEDLVALRARSEKRATSFLRGEMRPDDWAAVREALPLLSSDAVAINELSADLVIQSILTAQIYMQSSGQIDADEDGIGEYGTLRELAGVVGARVGREVQGGSDRGRRPGAEAHFDGVGDPVRRPSLARSLADVDADGILVLNGYCFRVYLPDTADPPGFTHEAGSIERPRLSGGSAVIKTNGTEINWCVYAWPEVRGETGHRVFMVSSRSRFLRSENKVAKWSGRERAPVGESAFVGSSFDSELAVGEIGSDGDQWEGFK